MFSIYLDRAFEAVADKDLNLGFPPLEHQVKTLEALNNNSLVINLSETGAGKTLAALLYLKELDSRSNGKNVLFIAPTNELLSQHERDIKKFVGEQDLKYNVVRVDAGVLSKMGGGRRGETLHRLIMNPYSFREVLPAGIKKGLPLILVTNPDIFYYAIYFRYHSHDRRNLFQDFIIKFNYIIIDEFHYYNTKQFANFLFFFTLSKSFGYFECEDRKICLLSATPSRYVLSYLERLNLKTAVVKSSEKKDKKIQVLSPAKVTFIKGSMEETEEIDKIIHSEYEKGNDGAVISNSLATINRLYRRFKKLDAGRITGPQTEKERRDAAKRSLIFATPTVDIGYNFQKDEKDRQNIDYLCLEAYSYDQLIQRLGRAGRVLGKRRLDYMSSIYVFLRDEDYELAGEILEEERLYSRSEFKEIMLEHNVPPQLRDFVNYVKSDAILEAMYSVRQIMGQLLPEEEHEELKQFFNDLKEVFNPETQKTFNYYQKIIGSFNYQMMKVENADKSVTVEDAESFFKWLGESVDREKLKELLVLSNFREEVYKHIERQYYTKKAIFNFRDSFNGPRAAVYDPAKLLSDSEKSEHDLFHLIKNYELTYFDRKEFMKICNWNVRKDFYVRIEKMREPSKRLRLQYKYLPEVEDFDLFRSRFINIPVALRGIEIIARLKGDVYPLPGKIKQAVKNRYILTFIASDEVAPALYKRIKNTGVYAEKISVDYVKSPKKEYSCIMGTGALLVYPELVKAIYAASRKKVDDLPVIL